MHLFAKVLEKKLQVIWNTEHSQERITFKDPSLLNLQDKMQEQKEKLIVWSPYYRLPEGDHAFKLTV